MTTRYQTRTIAQRGSSGKSPFTAVLIISFAVTALPSSGAAGGYEEDVLLNPSKATLIAESTGRVTIYDGLENTLVEHALDTQFDRIENMMFVRTRWTLPDGSEEVDGDCD
jgi:hypothetical protein